METAAAKKTFTLPLWALALIQSFTVWQMGVVYYSSRTFTLDGVTPLPVSVDTAVIPILLGYACGAALSYYFPRRVGLWARVLTAASLCCIALMFLPLGEDILAALYYISCFTCVSFISVDGTLAVNAYTLRTTLIDGIVCVAIPAPFVALLHYQPAGLDFYSFNLISAAIQLLILAGLHRVPLTLEMDLLPPRRGLPREKRVRPPALLLGGTVFSYGVICLCVLFSGTTAESVENGISIFYLSGGAWSALFAYICFRRKVSPYRLITVYLGIAALGYISWLLPMRALMPVSIALQGVSAALLGLTFFIAAALFERWNSRVIAPCGVLMGLITVLLHSGLLELLRDKPELLYALYAAIALTLLVVYFLTEPYFRRVWMDVSGEESGGKKDSGEKEVSLAALTKRENELASLLVRGYGNEDIARMLYISEHTVKTHVKNIYQKLGVHTRFELAARINGELKG